MVSLKKDKRRSKRHIDEDISDGQRKTQKKEESRLNHRYILGGRKTMGAPFRYYSSFQIKISALIRNQIHAKAGPELPGRFPFALKDHRSRVFHY